MIQWKKIPEFPKYLVSDTGEVKNSKRGTIRKKRLSNKGYYTVSFKRNKRQIFFQIHRLVMLAFKPNINAKILQVNHKNKIRTDNRMVNLEWATNKENNDHKIEFGKREEVGRVLFMEAIKKVVNL